MRNRYLELLGLEPGATKSEVKTAYRTLSKKYHPDVSKEEYAKDKFIEITEAYNFLIKVGPRPHNEETRYDYNPHESEYNRWRQKAKAKARKMARDKAIRQRELINYILRQFKYPSWAILAFNILLAVDYNLPKQSIEQRIIGVAELSITNGSSRAQGRAVRKYQEVVFEDFTMLFKRSSAMHLKDYSSAVVVVSPLLRKPEAAIVIDNGKEKVFPSTNGIYDVLAGIAFLVFFIFYLYNRAVDNLDHRLTMAIFMAFLMLIELYMFSEF